MHAYDLRVGLLSIIFCDNQLAIVPCSVIYCYWYYHTSNVLGSLLLRLVTRPDLKHDLLPKFIEWTSASIRSKGQVISADDC